MRYSLLRLSLFPKEIPPLIAAMREGEEQQGRQEWLRWAFGTRHEFIHRGSAFTYVPIGSEGTVMLGRLGRQRAELVNRGPETGFAETSASPWHAVNVLVETAAGEYGQILAMQDNKDVGSPHAVVSSLADHLNNINVDSRWRMEVQALTETQDFWEVVARAKGTITALDMTFVAPNIFGGRDKVREALRKYRDENNMTSLKTSMRNPDGNLDPDSERIRESLGYIEEGGGEVKMSSHGKTIYDSHEHDKTVDIPDEEDAAVNEENMSRWRSLIEYIFGK